MPRHSAEQWSTATKTAICPCSTVKAAVMSVRIGEERVDRGGEGGHVRRAERSTCGRVQIGSGFDSISSRTHSSRSRSEIARA